MLFFILQVLASLKIRISLKTLGLIHAISKVIYNKLTRQAVSSDDEATLISTVYDELPKKYKAPEGPVTQEELQELIQSIIRLYRASRAVFRH